VVVLARSERANQVRLLALRHEVTVLRRQSDVSPTVWGAIREFAAVVTDVRGSESVSTGHVIVVRWQDDHTIAALIPRSELELVDTKQQ